MTASSLSLPSNELHMNLEFNRNENSLKQSLGEMRSRLEKMAN